MQIFARLTKVNESERTVEGVIADETPDRAAEVFDYAASKPHFQAWSEGIAKATDGKNLGNVRVMHGNTVAGVTKAIDFDDAAKAITVKAHIVDDNEWKKTLAGCYTGFSIGGRYEKKWDDGDLKRYAAIPSEYSLVDLPCNPAAQFTVVKADGTQELRKYDTSRTDARQALAEKLAKRADAVSPVAKSIAALLGLPVEKGMCTVAELSDILGRLGWVADDSEWEAKWEGDGSTVPADLRDAIKTLAAILVRMATEESTELAASLAADKSTTGDLLKVAPTEEQPEMNEQLQKAHDEAKAALAKAEGDLKTANESLTKVTGERDDLAKAVKERDEALLKAAAHIEAQAALIEKMKDQPDALKIALTAVAKGEDITKPDDKPEDKVLKRDGTVDEVATALRKALRNPVMVR
jgi:hypothetical protein